MLTYGTIPPPRVTDQEARFSEDGEMSHRASLRVDLKDILIEHDSFSVVINVTSRENRTFVTTVDVVTDNPIPALRAPLSAP